MPSLPSNEGPYIGYTALATLFFQHEARSGRLCWKTRRVSGWSDAGGGGRSRTKFVHPAHQRVQGWKTPGAGESKENQGIRPVLSDFLLLGLS